MITYQVEPLFPDAIEEMKSLFEAHREDVGHRKPGEGPAWELNPDYDRYRSLFDAGVLHLCTARDDDNKIIGYYLNIMMNLLHYKHVKAAVSDIFFILPEYRKGRVGIALFKFMIEAVRQSGAQVIKSHCKSYHDIGPMVERMGFFEIERVYSLHLED